MPEYLSNGYRRETALWPANVYPSDGRLPRRWGEALGPADGCQLTTIPFHYLVHQAVLLPPLIYSASLALDVSLPQRRNMPSFDPRKMNK